MVNRYETFNRRMELLKSLYRENDENRTTARIFVGMMLNKNFILRDRITALKNYDQSNFI